MEANLRIDKGIRRGPRTPRNARDPVTKRFLPINGTQAAAIEQRDQIIGRLASGELLRDIAASLDVHPAAISQYLAGDEQYKAARESGIEQQLERWQEQIEKAEDPLNLARGREGFRAAAWRAEREFPRRWGIKQEITHSVSPVLHIHVAPEQQQVSEPIEHNAYSAAPSLPLRHPSVAHTPHTLEASPAHDQDGGDTSP